MQAMSLLNSINIGCNFLNDGSRTRIARSGGAASTLTLCSHDIAQRTNCYVVDDSYASDHLPIFMQIMYSGDNIDITYPTRRWKIDIYKMPQFTEYLNKHRSETTNYTRAAERITCCIKTNRSR